MLSVLFSLALAAQIHRGFPTYTQPAEVAATTPNPNYPLHLHILGSHRSYDSFGTKSYGRGNLIGSPTLGFDYVSGCPGGFLHNAEKDEFYQGRWKKPNQKIEILTQKIGSDHVDRCEISVTLKSTPYGRPSTPAAPPAAQSATPPTPIAPQ